MTYGLWKCYCGHETVVDTDRMPPMHERCEFCHPPKCAMGVPSPSTATVPGRVTLTTHTKD